MAKAMRAIKATPPTVPPAIAPTFVPPPVDSVDWSSELSVVLFVLF
jgi:hypothetical protein